MKSGLEDRNNESWTITHLNRRDVSMKSGLEDRNNRRRTLVMARKIPGVSMKSGLEDRNNGFEEAFFVFACLVSMKSGLEDRNNPSVSGMSPPWVLLSQ